MASIGTSGPLKPAEYDVFLSFRGKDTRKTFTDCLYRALDYAGIRVFKDDEEIHKGKEISTELPRAIDNSRICIPIFSKNYATSAWCLREVAHMVESRRKLMGALEILPIFYDVEVSDVKLQTGSIYEVQMEDHRARFEEDIILQWKNALKDVAKLKGWDGKSARGDGELIDSIVEEVVTKLKIRCRNIPTHLVDLDDQVTELINWIDVDSKDIRFLVIHGMGGIGKTTLANVVYNKLYSNYEGHSFLENVRERTEQYGLLYLQIKLLHDILNHDFAKDVRDINDGINMIRARLCFKKVLIVIDDVDENGQLQNLAKKGDWFGSGSRIIITTRNRAVVRKEGDARKYHFHEVKQMPFDDALCLFSWHAFGKDYPPHDYDDISKNIVSATASLPLALEVVGSSLCCQCLESCVCMEIWKDTLNELRRVPNKKVEETLMISINKLNDKQKEVFLDIACFFINENKTNATYMWRGCQFSPHLVINFLIQSSLIKIDVDNKFQMHDQLRDLGREIALQENSGRPSRVWIDKDAEELINNTRGKEQLEVLWLNSSNFTLTYDDLGKLRNIRFLKLQGGKFKRDLTGLFRGHTENLLPNLRWLCWHHLPSNFKMKNFCPGNLVVLELCNSPIKKHWKGWRRLKTASQLKVLDLTGCDRLKTIPNLSSFVHLERLILQGCCKLVEINPSIGKLERLTYLNMEGCGSLGKLPEEIRSLTSLTTIIMQGYGQKFQLPDSVGDLTSLTSLEIRSVSITKLPKSIGNLTNLKHLSLKRCRKLRTLPDGIGHLKSLVKLDISGSDIIELPDSIGNLMCLKVIDMSESAIRSLPGTFWLLKSLERLYARACCDLTGEIPKEFGGLSSLKILNLWDCKICGSPSSVDQLFDLKELHMTLSVECNIPDLRWMWKLSKLEKLSIKSLNIRSQGDELAFLELPSRLKTLFIDDLIIKSGTPPNCRLSLAAAIPCLGKLDMLRSLILRSCNFCDLDGLQHLRNLRNLSIRKYYEKFLDLSSLENLIYLELLECDGFVEIGGLGELRSLQALRIGGCKSLEVLFGLSNLTNLKALGITSCKKLRDIQEIDKLKSLDYLWIWDCQTLRRLPDMSSFRSRMTFLSINCPGLPKQESIGNHNPPYEELFRKYLEGI